MENAIHMSCHSSKHYVNKDGFGLKNIFGTKRTLILAGGLIGFAIAGKDSCSSTRTKFFTWIRMLSWCQSATGQNQG